MNDRRVQRILIGIVLMLPTGSASTIAAGPGEAVGWLQGQQSEDGSWGTSLALRDTAVVVEALGAIAPALPEALVGRAWLANQATDNVDFASRRVAALAASGITGEPDGLALLALKNKVGFDPGMPNFPDGGWGIAKGFATDTLDTALGLDALDAVGLNGGFSVTDEALAAGATNLHVWEISADAVTVRILITVSGSEVRLRMKQGSPPGPADPFFPLPPGTWLIVFPDLFPFTPGTNYITVESTGMAATYTMTASYETPTFDTRTLTEPLDYLKAAQNPDGGWGMQRGVNTDLATTMRTLRTLQRYDNYRDDAAMNSALAYLAAQQNPDGSFSDNGGGSEYLTALGLRVLASEEVCGAEAVLARDFLSLSQDPNGSWNNDPYTTALALLATTPPPPSDVEVAVDLEGVNTPIARTVTFVITDCDHPEGPVVQTMEVDITFGVDGQGSLTLTGLNSEADWISADEGHVLRRLLALDTQACAVSAVDFLGADQLTAGDFNDDQLIDVEDFALLAILWNLPGDEADATGDGMQDQQDLDVILNNIFALGDPVEGCPIRSGNSASGSGTRSESAKTSITVGELGRAGAERADANGDGMIDVTDIVLFARHNQVKVPASLLRQVQRYDRGEGTGVHNP